MKAIAITLFSATAFLLSCKKQSDNNTAPDINRGIVLRYEFANSLADISGNGFNGIGATSIDYVPNRFSKVNEAIRFNGAITPSYFMVPPLGSKQVDSVYSLSCWFTITTAGSTGLLYKADMGEAAESGYTLLIQNGKLRMIIGDGNADTKEFDDLTTLPANTWQHLVLTVNGPQSIAVYLNSEQVYNSMLLSFYDGFSKAAFKANAGSVVGLAGGKAPYPLMDGKMDDFRIYNRALSLAEVQQLYKLTQ